MKRSESRFKSQPDIFYQRFLMVMKIFVSKLTTYHPLILSLLTAIVSTVFMFATTIGDKVNGLNTNSWSLIEKILIICFLGPIIETLLFQKFIIKIAIKYTNSTNASVLISAFIFGIIHSYSFIYQMQAFVIGLLLGILYVTCINRNPSLYVGIAHITHNSIILGLVLAGI